MRWIGCLLLLVMFAVAPLTAAAQWGPDVRLTDDPLESVTCFNNARCVAADGSTIHVVWHDSRDGNTEIYYKRSTDDGTTWGADTRLTMDASWSERPALAVRGSSVHAVWYDGRLGPPRIYYKRSTDGGTSWGPDVCLTPQTGVGYHPSVAVCESIVHVAWADFSAGPQVYYARSLDDGANWEDARNITPTSPPAGKNLVSVAAVDDLVHVTWMDSRGGPRIYYTRSLDRGATWETDRAIVTVSSQFASLAVSAAGVHVAYADFREGEATPRIWYTRSVDQGATWEAAVPLAETFSSWYPSIAAAGSRVQALWLDNRHGDAAEVYAKESSDGGASWQPDARLTEHASESKEPSVALSGAYVHAVWHDDRDGNWEIYYKRGHAGGSGVDGRQVPSAAAARLLLAGPNPSSGEVAFRFGSAAATPVVLEIYAPSGALVRRFLQAPGSGEILWNGRDETGRDAPSGVYAARMEVDGTVMTGRLVLLR